MPLKIRLERIVKEEGTSTENKRDTSAPEERSLREKGRDIGESGKE